MITKKELKQDTLDLLPNDNEISNEVYDSLVRKKIFEKYPMDKQLAIMQKHIDNEDYANEYQELCNYKNKVKQDVAKIMLNYNTRIRNS